MSEKKVVRQDVVQIGFDTDLSELLKLKEAMEDFKKSVSGLGKEDGLDKTKKSTEGVKDEADKAKKSVQDLGKVSLSKLNDGIDKVGTGLTKIAVKTAGAAYNGLKKVAGVSFKALIAGAGAVAGVVGKAVTEYADFEQQIGGVETLFKKDANVVQKYANDAYKTAGLSANAYMETVTGFAASLLQSVGGDTKKSAELGNQAVVDMADNANKMGTSMEFIQTAYQGFAKQNYTMLDNLKLGYGGTKEEMARLVKDAAKLDKSVDASSMSYGNIVKAIHAVQVNLGITGTTAKEAEKTISGSLYSMKAAWGNLLPALIQGGDSFDQCVDNLVKSVKTFAGNVMPAIKKGLAGVGSLMNELSPIIAKELPSLINSITPPLIKSAGTLISGLVKAIPQFLPTLATGVVQVMGGLAKVIISNAPTIVKAVKQSVLEVAKIIYKGFTGQNMSGEMFATLKSNVETVFGSIKQIILGVVEFGKKLMSSLAPVLSFIGNLAINVFSWIGNNINWLLPLVTGLIAAFWAYKAVMVAVKVTTAIVTAAQTIMGTVMSTTSKTTTTSTTSMGKAAATSAVQVLSYAAAILAVGVAILAICVGFALLAQASIALANAGWGAIAVMGGLVLAIAGLAVGAAVLGSALTAGTVGFIAFGAAVLMVGAGFALIGVGALLAATSLSIIAGILPTVSQYGLQGALSIAVLGAGLLVFAVCAGVAGIASIALGTGLLIATAGLLAFEVVLALVAVTALAIVATFTAFSVVLLAIMVAVLVVTAQFTILSLCFTLMSASSLILSAALLPLAGVFTALTVPTLLFVATLTPLTAMFVALSAAALVFFTSVSGLLVVFTAITAIITLLNIQFVLMMSMFTVIALSTMLLVTALTPLTPIFLALVPPILAFTLAITPLTLLFVALSASALVFLASITALLALLTAMAVVTTLLNIQFLLMTTLFTLINTSVIVLITALTPLPILFTALVPVVLAFTLTLTPLTLLFTLLAVSAVAFAVSMTALTVVLTLVTALTIALVASVTILVAMVTVLLALVTVITATLTILSAMLVVLTATLTVLVALLTALTPLILLFTTALVPVSALMLALVPTTLLFTGTMAALMAIFVVLAPLAVLFAGAMAILSPIFSSLRESVPIIADALDPLADSFKSMIIPAGLLAVALAPLSAEFAVLSATAVILLASMSGLVVVTTLLVGLFTLCTMMSMLLSVALNMLVSVSGLLTRSLIPLTATLTSMVAPLGIVSASFTKFASSTTVAVMATLIMNNAFVQMVAYIRLAVMMLTVLLSLLRNIGSTFARVARSPQVFNVSLKNMASNSNAALSNVLSMLRAFAPQAESIVSQIATRISRIVDSSISSIVSRMKTLPVLMGNAIKSSGGSLSDSLVSIWKSAVKATVAPVNKLISGANWVLKQFGSSKTIASWSAYANGTDGHKGGNALVNDGRGAELVQMPNGQMFIPTGRNVFIPNAPVGMKVLSAEQTAQLFGRQAPTFRYAKGTGKFDVFDYIDNEKGLVENVAKKYVTYDTSNELALEAGKGLVSKTKEQMIPWVKKLFGEYGSKSIASYVASAGVNQWRSTVIQALKMEGQYSEANVRRTLYQMQTESGGNPRAINLRDSNAKKGIPSKGLMQCIDPTFKAYARPGYNKNIYDPLSNILASIRYALSRYGSLAKAYQGHGYANGGIATKPSVFGEAGAEMAIPLTKNKRKRGVDLWEKTGNLLGIGFDEYTPENSTTTNNTVQNNTYSPQFTLNMNGASATDSNKRAVKKWVKECMTEVIESMGRTDPELIEV